MSQNFRFRNNNRRNQTKQKNVQSLSATDEQNPVLKAFQEYANELDDKHDRHERLVKLSRDITIEAKRIIFLLHTIDARKNNRFRVLEEAEERLNKIIDTNFKAIALELNGYDPYQYRWAYSPGLQEFIEAYSFMEYFKCGGDKPSDTMSDWIILQEKMKYKEEHEKVSQTDDNSEESVVAPDQKQQEDKAVEKIEPQNVEFNIDPTEYILGIADLTGELMRRCINSLGSGETDVCLESCKVLKQLFTGYISLNVQRCRELSRKIYTMRQSVLKAENVCYNVKVRGGEAAKWGAVFETKAAEDLDEGFF
ncbi:translin-associated protein X [Anastrepha obliqua]|uniref:translin-associated protein X n=1 Tax=Anastrepha obliqua TaxID=95512 RepID=UPI002409ACA3|nr:translin-associated protein X [Anastrepha obliqua]XP_054725457.1 translin-associated protein X [Anastrepha obliqua]